MSIRMPHSSSAPRTILPFGQDFAYVGPSAVNDRVSPNVGWRNPTITDREVQ
jgi:hypothetical protein